jgi:GTPase SAR1 family protein
MSQYTGPAFRKKLVIVGDGACGKTSLLMYLTLRLNVLPRFALSF